MNLCKKYPREYNSFSSMRTRCLRKSHSEYKNYGGRGIKICTRWMEYKKGFANFLEDMGRRPVGMSLDRIDNNGPYSPENCRWATPKEQANNMSTNLHWEIGGESHTVPEWSEITGIPTAILHNRVKLYKWSIKKALTHPYISRPRSDN